MKCKLLLVFFILFSSTFNFSMDCPNRLFKLPHDILYEIFSTIANVDQNSSYPEIRKAVKDLETYLSLDKKVSEVITKRILKISPADATNLLCDYIQEDRESPQSIELLSFLLTKGADVNYRDSKGNPPLINLVEGITYVPFEAQYGFTTAADVSPIAPQLELLLEHGADISIGDARGKTIFDFVEDDIKNFINDKLKEMKQKKQVKSQK